jgi:hypothetical protein
MVAIILSIILFLVAGILFYYAKKTRSEALQKLDEANKIIIYKNQENEIKRAEREQLLFEIAYLESHKESLQKEIDSKVEAFEKEKKKAKASYEDAIKLYQENYSYAAEQYAEQMEKAYIQAELEHDATIQYLKTEFEVTQKDLLKLKEALSAGVQAQLREREKEENIGFYKLQVSDQDLSDIKTLNAMKHMLFQPVILSKLIWTTYFQKQTTELCNRILGIKKICGIYKITNLTSQQCYIGQSVDIAQRWKDHAKCGLGIDAPATNKLYKAMQEDGIWNFSFELLEECPREELNEKERLWIEMYQTDKFGYNATKGNK